MAYTNDQLTQFYPVDTRQHLVDTIANIDNLVTDGVLSDNDLRQLLPIVGAALDVHIEHVVVASATYTGTAGTATRKYRAVPVYPLPKGGAQNVLGKYINSLPTRPPGGRRSSDSFIGGNDGDLTHYVGGSAASPPTAVSVANTADQLDASNFVTIVAPASSASAVSGTLFDIYCTVTGGPNAGSYLVKTGAAAGETVLDKNEYRGTSYTLPAHTQFAVDTSGSTPVLLPGPRTFLNT